MTYRFLSRKFLNDKQYHELAAIKAYVTKADKYGVEASVKISDCSRSINLEFTVHNSSSKKHALKKINKLIEVLTKFQEALESECHEYISKNKSSG